MKRWLPGLVVLTLLGLVAVPIGAGAQGKDTLTVALPSHAPTLDPHMHFERVGILVNSNMFDSLLHRSAKLEFEPSLALSWKALNDTTWEFKLRKGVKFHDGSILTAEDVKFSFDRVLEPGKEQKKSPQYGNVRAIKEVKIVNADTIHLITDKPFPLLLERVVFFPIVPKKHIEKVGEEAFGSTATVGTGPWKLVEWKRDQHIRLEAFDQHWRGKPAFKYVVFRAIPEVATALRGSRADAHRGWPPHDGEDVGPGPGVEQVLPGRRQGHERPVWQLGKLLGLRRRRRAASPLSHGARWLDRQALRARRRARQAHRRGPLERRSAQAQADLRGDPEDDPRGGALDLPVHAERHARHLEEGRLRGASRRVALAVRGQAGELRH